MDQVFANRYDISTKDIMKYMASRVIDRTVETIKRLSAVLNGIQTKNKSLRASIINNKNKFIKLAESLKQNKTRMIQFIKKDYIKPYTKLN